MRAQYKRDVSEIDAIYDLENFTYTHSKTLVKSIQAIEKLLKDYQNDKNMCTLIILHTKLPIFKL